MSYPKTESIPDDPDRLPPARRRRARRLLAPFDSDERASYLDDLAHRTSPSFDFFLFSFISALVLAGALMADAPALLLLGALIAPFMSPALGLSLGTVVGSVKLVLRSAGGLIVGILLVAGVSALAGYLAALFELDLPLVQAHLLTQISWGTLLMLVVTAILAAAALANTPHRPGLISAARVASVGIAYALYAPLAAAGYGFGSGVPDLFPDGLVVLVIYLSWTVLFAALTLAVLGCRPLTLFGYTFGAAVTLLGIVAIVGLGGVGAVFGAQVALPTPIPTATATITPTYTLTPSSTPTDTPTVTPEPSITPSLTPTDIPTNTPSPTPMYALVNSPDDGGARLRSDPGFNGYTIQIYLNGTLMVVLDETMELEGYVWVKVRAPDGNEGWMLASLLKGTDSP